MDATGTFLYSSTISLDVSLSNFVVYQSCLGLPDEQVEEGHPLLPAHIVHVFQDVAAAVVLLLPLLDDTVGEPVQNLEGPAPFPSEADRTKFNSLKLSRLLCRTQR